MTTFSTKIKHIKKNQLSQQLTHVTISIPKTSTKTLPLKLIHLPISLSAQKKFKKTNFHINKN